MKRYSLIVVLHIIGIAFLSVGVYLLVDAGLWFSALMAFLILLAIAVHLYRLQMMQVRMMRHLAESLRYDDMMLSFRSPYKKFLIASESSSTISSLQEPVYGGYGGRAFRSDEEFPYPRAGTQ